ncbi:insulin-like 3 [Suncus etruscus]|uniref:insulin-like 3 n=1 Tax=Suncus etruscus TaxID=109475 RepID=UPI0021100880|nr:insulin-like 3 [Suncus etruscus]
MALRTLPWALALLGAALALSLAPARAQERPEQLCGLRFVRTIVRLCGGPRWAPEDKDRQPPGGGDQELLQWLERSRLQGLAAARDPELDPGPETLWPPRNRKSRGAAPSPLNPAWHCCLHGCTRHTLLSLCPH